MEDINNALSSNNTQDLEEFIEILDLLEEESTSSRSDDSEIEEVLLQPTNNFVNSIDSFPEDVFKSHMRLKQSTVEFFIMRFTQSAYSTIEGIGGRRQIKEKAMVYMYVWYISNTVTYRQLGSLFGVMKSTAWRAVRRVTSWLISISHEFIKWPEKGAAERISAKFYQKQQIPGVIGCIDCTHININAPLITKECYFDRKQNYSLILQAVVDADKKFIGIYCGEPGSLHDSRVLRRSQLFINAGNNYSEMFPQSMFILGDSAFFGTRWLVTPFKDNGQLMRHQKHFNVRHSRTRVVVENAFGLLKGRFRRLLKFTDHRDLNAIVHLIASACVLHNICNVEDDLCEVENDEEDPLIFDDVDEESFPEQTTNRRDQLFRDLLKQNIL